MNGGKSANDAPIRTKHLEAHGFNTKGWDSVEAYCPNCDEPYTLTEAEDRDWECTCGRRIERN